MGIPANPLYRKAILVYLLAIVAPALVLLYFGVVSFQRQRQAADALLQSNLRLSGEKLAAEVERRANELALECLRGDTEISRRKHALARYFFAIDGGRVVYPPVHTPAPSTVDELLAGEPSAVRQEYSTVFRNAELQELQTYGTLTDADGSYKITHLRAGEYNLRVQRTGFVDTAYTAATKVVVKVIEGDSRTGQDVKLVPQGTITGRVVTPRRGAHSGC